MKLDIKTLASKLQPVIRFLKLYAVFIIMIGVLFIIGFFVFRINQLSNLEPSEEAVSEKLKTVQRPRIDQSAVERIEQLQGQNIQVQALFDQARDNPFSE